MGFFTQFSNLWKPKGSALSEDTHPAACDDEGVAYVTNPPGRATLTTSVDVDKSKGVVDLSTASNCVAITASSVAKLLPEAGGVYYLLAVGNSCYVLTGGVGVTATATVTTGFGTICPEGVLMGPWKLNGPYLAVIGATAAGNLCIIHVRGF
jgi:hypothetical protein